MWGGGSQSSVEAEEAQPSAALRSGHLPRAAPGASPSLVLPVCKACRGSKWQPWVRGGEWLGLMGRVHPAGVQPSSVSLELPSYFL